ncbi:response regulator transcription factor [Hyalangium rubrum]|uniref:Response regulator n=1 Tax=Hyalangium rubrum TaxID=3103134 RepID=A0ABU5GWR0_9BACT|nr:response regulator [Hyalangium sp. s54d21]MDY7225307.1 response regulator [Hyalangium sp. s54d21]
MATHWRAKQTVRSNPLRAEQAHRTPRPLRVLLGEDQSGLRSLIRSTLMRDGYEVQEAEDGPTTLRALVAGLLEEQPRELDLLIADVRMPGFPSLELLARLRRENWFTPVIFITSSEDTALHAEAARLGAACVPDKPFELADLWARMRMVLSPA